MSDRLFLSLMAAAAAAMLAFSLVWPQGLGARSPWPFGHTPVQQTPAAQAAVAREAARAAHKNQAQINAAAAQLRRLNAPPGQPLVSSAAPTPAASAPSAGLRSGE
jgi:hypothetical protein